MLDDKDRIFTNIYGMHDRSLAGARALRNSISAKSSSLRSSMSERMPTTTEKARAMRNSISGAAGKISAKMPKRRGKRSDSVDEEDGAPAVDEYSEDEEEGDPVTTMLASEVAQGSAREAERVAERQQAAP